MLVGVEGRAVPLVVAEEGEEGVDVFRLVVGPNRGIVGFSARAVHQAAGSLVDALRATDFGEGEHGIDDRVGRVEDKAAPERLNQRLPSLKLLFHIGDDLSLPLFEARRRNVERDLLSGLELAAETTGQRLNQVIRPGDTAFLRRQNLAADIAGLDRHRLVSQVLQRIFFTKSRQGSRGEEDARQFDFTAPHRAETPDRHRAVQRDALHLFAELRVADEHILQGIPTHLAHQAGVGIIRNRPEQGPDHAPVQEESAVRIDAVAHDGRDLQSAHFDMITMRRIARPDLPCDAALGVQRPPLRLDKTAEARETEKKEDEFTHDMIRLINSF